MNDAQWAWLSDVLGVQRPPANGMAGAPGQAPPAAAGAAEAKKRAEDANTAVVARFNAINDTFEMEAPRRAFLAAYQSFKAAYESADYATAMNFVTAMETAVAGMEAIATEQPKKQMAANAEAATINALSDRDVKTMSTADKAAAVRTLLAGGAPTGDARKAQIKIYRNTDLDPAFLKADEARGDEVAEDLRRDPELRAARTSWKTTSEADKIKTLKKIVAVQSKHFGIAPPEIVIVHEPPVTGPTGPWINFANFSADDGKLRVNMDPASSVHTFQTAVDLALHEVAHKWQLQLVKDLQAGKLKESDPNYKQALMFAVNALQPGGYVEGSEDEAAYRRQPLENHAAKTGSETARKIMRGL